MPSPSSPRSMKMPSKVTNDCDSKVVNYSGSTREAENVTPELKRRKITDEKKEESDNFILRKRSAESLENTSEDEKSINGSSVTGDANSATGNANSATGNGNSTANSAPPTRVGTPKPSTPKPKLDYEYGRNMTSYAGVPKQQEKFTLSGSIRPNPIKSISGMPGNIKEGANSAPLGPAKNGWIKDLKPPANAKGGSAKFQPISGDNSAASSSRTGISSSGVSSAASSRPSASASTTASASTASATTIRNKSNGNNRSITSDAKTSNAKPAKRKCLEFGALHKECHSYPEKLLKKMICCREGYYERIQAQVVLSGSKTTEEPSGLYVLQARKLRPNDPYLARLDQDPQVYADDVQVCSIDDCISNDRKHDDKIEDHKMHLVFNWLMILQNPSVPGPKRLKVPPSCYSKIPMICEQKMFATHPTSGNIFEAQNAMNYLIALNNMLTKAKKDGLLNANGDPFLKPDGTPSLPQIGERHIDRTKLGSLFSVEEKVEFEKLLNALVDSYPLPECFIDLRWVQPSCCKGDLIFYTGFHGNVSVEAGITSVQHIDYIPDLLLKKYMLSEKIQLNKGQENIKDIVRRRSPVKSRGETYETKKDASKENSSSSVKPPVVGSMQGEERSRNNTERKYPEAKIDYPIGVTAVPSAGSLLKPENVETPKMLPRAVPQVPPATSISPYVKGNTVNPGLRPVPAQVMVTEDNKLLVGGRLVDELMTGFKEKFSKCILDVGSGSSRTAEEESRFYEYKEGIAGVLPPLTEQIESALRGEVESFKESASSSIAAHANDKTNDNGKRNDKGFVKVSDVVAVDAKLSKVPPASNPSWLESAYESLSKKGYLILKAEDVFADMDKWEKEVDEGVFEAEQIVNFSMLYHNVPIYPVEKQADKYIEGSIAASMNSAQSPKSSPFGTTTTLRKPIKDINKCSYEPLWPLNTPVEKYPSKDIRFDKIRRLRLGFNEADKPSPRLTPQSTSSLQQTGLKPNNKPDPYVDLLLRLGNPSDRRWNYLRSEADRKELCGFSKCFYLNPNGGARFGNSFLTRESGMGKICNVYRNTKLLNLQTKPQIRHILLFFYNRMLRDMVRCEEKFENKSNPNSSGNDNQVFNDTNLIKRLYLIPERLRIKSNYGKLGGKTVQPWHKDDSHMMPSHADKHLIVTPNQFKKT